VTFANSINILMIFCSIRKDDELALWPCFGEIHVTSENIQGLLWCHTPTTSSHSRATLVPHSNYFKYTKMYPAIIIPDKILTRRRPNPIGRGHVTCPSGGDPVVD